MQKISAFFLVFLFLACSKQEINTGSPLPVVSQGIISSVKNYGGSKNDVGQSIVATSDGGFVVLGYTQSSDGDITNKNNDSFDYWLLKFDQNANLLWNKTYGGSSDDRGRDIIQMSDGGFAILGYSASSDGNTSTNNGLRDFWLAKTDAQGNLLWQKSYGFSGSDEGITLIETSDNHLMIAGVLDVTASGGSGNSGRNSNKHAGGDYWALKVDLAGGVVWSRYYGGSFTDTPFGIVQTTSGEFLFVGSSDSNDVDISGNKGSYDFWLVKANSRGNLAWEKSYGGTEIDEARGIIPSQDGNFLIVGDTRSNDIDVSKNNGAADVWLIKISGTGNLLWNQSYGGTNFDVPRSIIASSDGGYIISGSSRSSDIDLTENKGQNDAWILKVNNQGQLLWQRSIGGSEIDFAYDHAELKNGSIIAIGETSSSNGDLTENKGFTDLLLVKLN